MGFFKIIPLTHSRQYAESQNNLFDLIKWRNRQTLWSAYSR